MAKRWERTKAPTVTHRPHRAPLTAMHVIQVGKNTQGAPLQPANCGLLSASLATGVAMRSYPFTGKVVRGHFDASSTTTALGLGINPNFQEAFSNVSALALASSGGTGLVIWGLRSGGVAVTVAPRAMEVGCSARMVKCTLGEAHGARVDTICVDEGINGAEYFATGAADGSAKLWTLPVSQRGQLSCVWAGGYTDVDHLGSDIASPIATPCLKVAIDIPTQIISAGFSDGTVLVWFGVSPSLTSAESADAKCIRVPPPSLEAAAPATLRLYSQSRNDVSVLVHHFGDDHFYRLSVDKVAGLSRRVRFGGGPVSDISAITTEFVKYENPDIRTASSSAGLTGTATSALSIPYAPDSDGPSPPNAPLHLTLPAIDRGSALRERSFVVAGDTLGRICVWDWDGIETPVCKNVANVSESDPPKKDGTLEVHASIVWDAADGDGIAAIAWSDVVVAVGTIYGDTLIFDSLTQRLLKRIPSPSPTSAHHGREGVSRIVINGDVLLVGVGSQVLAWQARKESGKPVSGWGKATKVKKSKAGGTAAKWQQRNELNTEISHSLHQLNDENARTQPALRRARAQAGALAEMGMDESEAVQYLMMLSRDEEDARLAARAANITEHENGEPSETGSPTHSNSNTFYGSPTGSTQSTVPSTSTSPSSRRSGPSIYIPASRRPRSNMDDPTDSSPYTARSPYGSYQSSRSHRSGPSNPLDEDEELRMVLELSLLEQ